MFKRMCQYLTNFFVNISKKINKRFNSRRQNRNNILKKIFRWNGDYHDGLYQDNDSRDETELVGILNNMDIIHPYKEDSCVIFHNNSNNYKYDRLPSISPDNLIDLNEENEEDHNNEDNQDNDDNDDNKDTDNNVNNHNIDLINFSKNNDNITEDYSLDIYSDARET